MSTTGFMVLIVFLVLILLLIFLLLIPFNLKFSFSKVHSEKLKSKVTLETFGGKLKKTIEIPKKKKHKKKDNKKEKKDKLSFTQKVKKYYNAFKLIKSTWKKSKKGIRKRILLKKAYISVTFGTGSASQTGIATGALWAGIYDVFAFFSNFIRITEPDVKVNPVYDEERLELEGECILRLTLANIISIITIISLNYLKEKRKLTKKEKAAIKNGNSN